MATGLIGTVAEEIDSLTDVVWQGALARAAPTVIVNHAVQPAYFGDASESVLRANPADGDHAIAAAAAVMEQRAYVGLPFGVVPDHVRRALADEYRRRVACGLMRTGDAQNPGRLVAHDDPFARGMQGAFSRLVERIAGQSLVASYTYAAFYGDDGTIEPHTDRRQCEVTMAICIERATTPGVGSCLVIERDGVEALLPSHAGRAVVFRGSELRHGRVDVTPGARPAVVLLHYVDAGFVGHRD